MCGMRDEEGEEGRRVAIVARRLEGLSTRLDGPMPNVLQAIAGFVLKGCSHRLGVVSKGVGERGERGERGIYRGGETIESEMIALLVLSPFSPLHLTIDLMRSGLVYHACSLHWQVHSLPPSINSVSPTAIDRVAFDLKRAALPWSYGVQGMMAEIEESDGSSSSSSSSSSTRSIDLRQELVCYKAACASASNALTRLYG